MLDPLFRFFSGIFGAVGRGIRALIAWFLFPFLSASRWYASRGMLLKAGLGIILLALVAVYGHFVWVTQVWNGFNPDFVAAYRLDERQTAAGQELPSTAEDSAKKCQRSAIVDVTADLIDQEVNQNTWISSSPLYKMGFFGLDWDNTPFLDNKASFQRGVNQTVRRTTVELVDALARVRGTSGINVTLQSARSNMQYDEMSWYVGLSPLGFRTPTPKIYQTAYNQLKSFNAELENCESIFDGRADNLLEFLDRIANDLGSTSAMLRDRSENYNSGWFDTRADDRFWFAYGQMYGYYAILSAARADFAPVIRDRSLAPIWSEMLKQFRAALNIQPAIISNGREDGWIMPTHLATQGFYILRARSQLVEIRDILSR